MSKFATFGFLLGLFLAVAAGCAASDQGFSAGSGGPPAWVGKLFVRINESDTWIPLSGIEYGAPQGWSLSSTYVRYLSGDLTTSNRQYAFAVTVSPGSDGARISAGLAAYGIGHALVVAELDLAVLRTWGDPVIADSHSTYVGVEAKLSMLLGGAVGYYRRVGHDEAGRTDSFFGIRYRIALW
jgi:hypothetical protein